MITVEKQLCERTCYFMYTTIRWQKHSPPSTELQSGLRYEVMQLQHQRLNSLALILMTASFTLARNGRVIDLQAPQKWTKQLAGLVT